jgi:hypothetical protein
MVGCPTCGQTPAETDAAFCPYCGAPLATTFRALPEGDDRHAAERPTLATAVALAGLALAVTLAVVLSLGANHTRLPILRIPVAPPPAHPAPPAPPVPPHTFRYNAGSYSVAYPAGWTVVRGDQPRGGYFETVLHSPDGAARVTLDHVPGETTAPAAKAAQVESATSRTPGYRRLGFQESTIAGRTAVEWIFTVTDASAPQRADLFVNTGRDGFALLAYGADFQRAMSTARAIAASLRVRA